MSLKEWLKLDVVLGANGNIGSYVVNELRMVKGGDPIRAVSKTGKFITFVRSYSVKGVKANALDLNSLQTAVKGASTIYHCIGRPYAKYSELRLIMDNVIQAATKEGPHTKVVYADVVHMYGRESTLKGPLTETMPHRAQGPKGKLRAELAEKLLQAHKEGRLQATIGRGSDYFGPGKMYNSFLNTYVFEKLGCSEIRLFGNLDKVHSFTFIPDFARALVTLGKSEKAFGQVWHIPHICSFTLRKTVESILKFDSTYELHVPPEFWDNEPSPIPPIRNMAKTQISPEYQEFLYQWEHDWQVDSTKFTQAFSFSSTPFLKAVEETCEYYYLAGGEELPKYEDTGKII